MTALSIRALVAGLDITGTRRNSGGNVDLEVTIDDLASIAKAGALGAVVLLTFPAPASPAPEPVDRGPRAT